MKRKDRNTPMVQTLNKGQENDAISSQSLPYVSIIFNDQSKNKDIQ